MKTNVNRNHIFQTTLFLKKIHKTIPLTISSYTVYTLLPVNFDKILVARRISSSFTDENTFGTRKKIYTQAALDSPKYFIATVQKNL